MNLRDWFLLRFRHEWQGVADEDLDLEECWKVAQAAEREACAAACREVGQQAEDRMWEILNIAPNAAMGLCGQSHGAIRCAEIIEERKEPTSG